MYHILYGLEFGRHLLLQLLNLHPQIFYLKPGLMQLAEELLVGSPDDRRDVFVEVLDILGRGWAGIVC